MFFICMELCGQYSGVPAWTSKSALTEASTEKHAHENPPAAARFVASYSRH
jgi:hypothetical protein